MIRGTSLQAFAEVVEEVGGDPAALLAADRIDLAVVGNPDDFLAYSKVVSVIDRAARTTGTPDFGRRLALRQGIEILGAVGVAARTARTMGDGLEICSTYLAAYSPSVQVQMEPAGREGQIFFEFRIVTDVPARPEQTVELALGITLNVFRHLAGTDYRPLAAHLPHAALAPVADYRAYYGCPVRFEQHAAGFVMRARDLEAPLVHDRLAHEAVVRYLDSVIGDLDAGLTRPVRDLITRLLPTGAVTIDLVARQLLLHPKTLQRRLAQEGATFAKLVEQTRRDLAYRYLGQTELGLSQIARELGYAEQSVLTRSCRRWFGNVPSAIRAQRREGRSAP